jgi:hypothetical protein
MGNRAIFRQFIQFKCESLQEYNSYVERNVQNSLQEIQKQYEDFIAKNPGIKETINDEYDDYLASYIDDLSYQSQKLSKDIVWKHRQSMVFHFYSFFEKELFHIAAIIGHENIFKMRDIKGNSPFEQFKLYLKKIDSELLENINSDLIYFDRIRLVRNFITHHDSIIKDNDQHYKKLVEFSPNRFRLQSVGKNKQGVEPFRILLENKEFIVEIFENFDKFMDKIYN